MSLAVSLCITKPRRGLKKFLAENYFIFAGFNRGLNLPLTKKSLQNGEMNVSHKYLIGLTLLIFIAGCSSSSTKTSPEQKIKSDSTQSIQVKLPSCNPSKGLDLTNYELALQASVKAGFENIKNAEAKVSGKYSVRLLAI
ncbi:MAG: hypothetical protein MI743_08730, partial [Sneathiellales bacterium]|nr:hypothetical protein [Sneathiellales bacterium]